MNREDALEIGIIAKTRGISGEIILELKDPSVEQNIKESVHLEIDGLLVPFFINSIRSISSTRFRIIFDWVNTEDKAAKLTSNKVYIPTANIQNNTETEMSPSLLEGFEVVDQQKGSIGTVNQFIEHDKNPLLIITHNKTEILFPFQSELILEIDSDKKIIHINAPEGLIDLYL